MQKAALPTRKPKRKVRREINVFPFNQVLGNIGCYALGVEGAGVEGDDLDVRGGVGELRGEVLHYLDPGGFGGAVAYAVVTFAVGVSR